MTGAMAACAGAGSGSNAAGHSPPPPATPTQSSSTSADQTATMPPLPFWAPAQDTAGCDASSVEIGPVDPARQQAQVADAESIAADILTFSKCRPKVSVRDGNLRIAASAADIPALWAEFSDDGLWLQPVRETVGGKAAPCWPRNPNESYDFGDDQGVCYHVDGAGVALHKKLFLAERHGNNLLITIPRNYLNSFNALAQQIYAGGGRAALISGYQVLVAATFNEPTVPQQLQLTLTGMTPAGVTHLMCDLSGCSLGGMRAVDKIIASG